MERETALHPRKGTQRREEGEDDAARTDFADLISLRVLLLAGGIISGRRATRVNRDGSGFPVPGQTKHFFLIPINHLKCHLPRVIILKAPVSREVLVHSAPPSPVHGDTPVLLPSSPSLVPLPWLGREIENTMARERMHEQRRALLVARVFNPGENTR